MAGRRVRRLAGAATFITLAAAVLVAAVPGAPDTTDTGGIVGRANVMGTVTFEGTAPAPVAVDMSGDPYCAGANAANPVRRRTVAIDREGRLADVVVYVKEGLAAGEHPVAQEAVMLDQQNCMYRPRVVALQARQPILIRNSDETLHNVHVRARNNREFNLGQIRGVESRRTFATPEVGIRVTCDIHGWMSSSIAVFDHPFFAISGDTGGYTIGDLPPGEYLLEAWHASLGTQQQRVTVSAGGTATASFTFQAQ